MEQDQELRAAARVIYEECYPSEEWATLPFDDAERHGTVHYRQAVGAAQQARSVMMAKGSQLPLPVIL